MTDHKPERLLRRAALGVWFCVIATLGLLQFYAHATHGQAFDPGLVAWLWLAGSLVLATLGIVIIVREVVRG